MPPVRGTSESVLLRPLRRLSSGAWQSRDGRWTFLRHHTDPKPQRWFVYDNTYGDDAGPCNIGGGEVTLAEVLECAEKLLAEELRERPK